ncbi:N-acetylmuramoyl-L-alanine amidase [Kitasatospora sp. NPDC048540]|uniref:N-acetylmuramoyl-L-alanine amidase n=2 Tax=unclassified Kitasatospora TaxID=2633591 RepID=UPI0033E5DCC1
MTRPTSSPTPPEHPEHAEHAEYPDGSAAYPARRRRLRRTVLLGCAAVPICLGGWLGWQALADSGPAGSAGSADRAGAAGSPSDPAGEGHLDGATGAPAEQSGTPGAAASPDAPSAAASPGTPAAAGGATPLAGRTVLLDPGHNTGNAKYTTEINRQVDIGNARKECDTTGTSTNNGYSEAEYTLDVARRARQILQDRGAKVVFTQDGDRPWGPCIDERAGIGNAAKADVALSVHGDGAPASAGGFHVIMPGKVTAGKADTSAIVEPSHRLGVLLRDTFKAATGEPFADYIGKQGLDTRTDLGGLNLSTVPKVFIECGNMRNAGDAGRMTDPQWRQRAAQGIADALTTYLTTS